MNWKEDKKFVCLYNSAQKIGEKVQYQVRRWYNPKGKFQRFLDSRISFWVKQYSFLKMTNFPDFSALCIVPKLSGNNRIPALPETIYYIRVWKCPQMWQISFPPPLNEKSILSFCTVMPTTTLVVAVVVVLPLTALVLYGIGIQRVPEQGRKTGERKHRLMWNHSSTFPTLSYYDGNQGWSW